MLHTSLLDSVAYQAKIKELGEGLYACSFYFTALSDDFINAAAENNILIFTFPSHNLLPPTLSEAKVWSRQLQRYVYSTALYST